MNKPETFGYFFSDEPQFKTSMSRAQCAAYLKAVRHIGNGNRTRYKVKRTGRAQFSVQLHFSNTPTALIEGEGLSPEDHADIAAKEFNEFAATHSEDVQHQRIIELRRYWCARLPSPEQMGRFTYRFNAAQQTRFYI
jgi:hypothetical protein